MGYRKHFAYYTDSSVMDSWVCICDRTGNHMDTRPGSEPADLPLFELGMDGQITFSDF